MEEFTQDGTPVHHRASYTNKYSLIHTKVQVNATNLPTVCFWEVGGNEETRGNKWEHTETVTRAQDPADLYPFIHPDNRLAMVYKFMYIS